MSGWHRADLGFSQSLYMAPCYDDPRTEEGMSRRPLPAAMSRVAMTTMMVSPSSPACGIQSQEGVQLWDVMDVRGKSATFSPASMAFASTAATTALTHDTH
jgi:hypothetical protein